MTVTRTGFNVWDEQWESGDYNDSDGLPHAQSTRIRTKNPIPCKPSTSYYYVSTGIRAQFFYYDSNDNFISTTGWYEDRVITTPSNCHYMRFYLVDTTSYDSGVGINYPSTDTAYHAYTGTTIPITFPTTIYGGSDEVIGGKLIDDTIFCTFNSTVDSPYSKANEIRFYVTNAVSYDYQEANLKCNRFKPSNFSYEHDNRICLLNKATIRILTSFEVSDWDAYLSENPVEISYKVETPTEYTLTPAELTTLYGTNNIWSNTGDITVTYIAKSAKFSFNSPLHRYNFVNLKLFNNTYIEHGKG